MATNLNENLSSCEHQSDSMIQGAGRGTEKRRRKTNRNRRSQRVGDQGILNERKIREVDKYLV